MKRRMRIIVVVAALAGLQLAALLVYRVVEGSRSEEERAVRFAAERLRGAEAAPAFDAARVDGTAVRVSWPAARARIVHFWATWCEPCRQELPGLLALARELEGRGVEMLAVAVDDEWDQVRDFFGGQPPPEVVIARDPSAHKRYGVSTLPDTYLIDRAGKLLERVHGARDWRSAAARDHLLTFVE